VVRYLTHKIGVYSGRPHLLVGTGYLTLYFYFPLEKDSKEREKEKYKENAYTVPVMCLPISAF
jgi:hypothetical protein